MYENEGLKRRAIVLDEMMKSYARYKGYELQYNSDNGVYEDHTVRHYAFSIDFIYDREEISFFVKITKTTNLYYEFNEITKRIENYFMTRTMCRGIAEAETQSEYIKKDVGMTRTMLRDMLNSTFGIPRHGKSGRFPWGCFIPEIKDVIFNGPATIVFWSDGTKTVVKCQEDDEYDPEKGLAMAISKKALGNKGNYCNVFHKWLETYEAPEFNPVNKMISDMGRALRSFGGDIIGD